MNGAVATPERAVWRSVVRTGDCDWFGHANNAVYSDYVASATLAAWGKIIPGAVWSPRHIRMTFKSPVTHGDKIQVECLPAGREDGGVRGTYRITRLGDEELVAESIVSWELRDTAGAPVVCDDWPVDPQSESVRLRETPGTPNRPEARVYRKPVRVQPYESDHTGFVSATWMFRWAWASMFAASAQAGWPTDRWHSEGFLVFQNHRDADVFAAPRVGDDVLVESRLYDIHRVRGTWEHRILHDGEVIAIDRATGVFLNLEGKITPPPEGMMSEIIEGPVAEHEKTGPNRTPQ